LNLRPPPKTCQDSNCPFHGGLKVRGRLLSGKAVGVAANNMVVVQRESYKYNTKYMRYFKQRNKLHAHIPACLEISLGDSVLVAECRPLSKTISFVAVQRNAASEALASIS